MPCLEPKPKKGFTLIELLVVIAIIGILAGAVLYSMDNARQRGRDQKRKEDLKSLNSALVAYHTDNKTYPPNTGSQRDFASDVNPGNWINGIQQYLEEIPTDPHQALIGSVASAVSGCNTASTTVTCTYSISSSGDDVQATHDGTENNTSFSSNTSQGLLIGRSSNGYFHKVGLRFTGINIPRNTNITKAALKLTPKSSGNPAGWPSNTSVPVDTRMTSDITDKPGSQFTNYTNFLDQLVAAEDYPPPWHHITNINGISPWSDTTQKEIDITAVVQREINGPNWNSSADNINLIWYPQDYQGSNMGRIFHSYESDPTKAASIEIVYESEEPPPPSPPPPPPSTDRGACDGKSVIYCLRLSDDKRVYVLWGQLENLNDRDLATRNEAVCKANDPDFSTDPTNTSPFKGLGRPHNSTLNYCIKSTL